MIAHARTGSRRRARGQNAVLEAGLASAIAASLLGVLLLAQQGYTRGQVAVAAGEQEANLAAAVAGYVQANYQGFLNAFNGGTTCGGTAGGGFITYPINDQAASTLPNVQGAAGTTCQNINTMIPSGTQYQNPYHQNFELVVGTITPPAGQPYLTAILTTVGGAPAPDNEVGIAIKKIGSAGAMLASATNQAALGNQANGTTHQFQLDPASWNGAITAGHPIVYLDYALSTNVNQNLERFASGTDAGPNKMSATLYLNGRDSSNGNPVNLALSGPAIPSGTALALQAQAGQGVQPRNGILGARQVDTQTLTGGASVGNPYTNDSAQGTGEYNAGETINDGAYTAYAGHTILANANLDVTSGYRLAAEGGLHVMSSAALGPNGQSITANDRANSANGSQPPITNGQLSTPGAIGVPGVTWDLANGSGLMAFFDATHGAAQFWIGTYAGTTAYTGLVGFEADGGIRSPVYYDNQNASYYIRPAGNSQVAGDFTAGGIINAGINVEAGQDVIATRDVNAGTNMTAGCNVFVGTAQYPAVAGLPNYSGCGTVFSWDVHTANTVFTDNGVEAISGNILADNGYIKATNSYLQTGLLVTFGTPCTMGNGAIAISQSDSTPAWCQNGVWVRMNNIFTVPGGQHLRIPGAGTTLYTGINNNGGPMMITTDCGTIGVGEQGDAMEIAIADATTGTALSHNILGTGGSNATFPIASVAAAVIPAGDSFIVTFSGQRFGGADFACDIHTLN